MKYDEINEHQLMKKWFGLGNANHALAQTRRRIHEHVPTHFENINSQSNSAPYIFGVNDRHMAYLIPDGFRFVDEVLKIELAETNNPVSINLLENTADEIAEQMIMLPRYAERTVSLRQGQPEFRQNLISLYGRCMVTGCMDLQVLEACHIVPYSSSHDNSMTNGLLLRADIHTLFDGDLLTIDSDFVVKISDKIKSDEYRALDGLKIKPHHSLNLENISENLKNSC